MGNSERESSTDKKRRLSDKRRLESWKAIANYLNRSVRTVRRWEANEDLPVYRHRHKKRASVYAYCSELDAWRLGHRGGNAEAPPEHSENRDRRFLPQASWRLAIPVVVAFIGGIVVGISVTDLTSPGVESSLVSATPDKPGYMDPPSSNLDDVTSWPESIARSVTMPVILALAGGRIQDALVEKQKILQQLSRYPPDAQYLLIGYLVDISLAMGRIDDARKIVAVVQDSNRRYELQARIMFALGDQNSAREQLQQSSSFVDDSTPLLMAITGLVEEALELNSKLGSEKSREGRSSVILAMAAMAGKDKKEAESKLRMATAQLIPSDQGYYLVALDMLSGLRRSEGQLMEAIDLLERTSPQRDVAVANNAGIFWLMCQRQLATLYREAGQEHDATAIENALRDALKLADENFPLAQSLSDV